MRLLLATALALLALAAPSQAATALNASEYLAAAVTYYGETASSPVVVTHDEEKIAADASAHRGGVRMGALAYGCNPAQCLIVVSDAWNAMDVEHQCFVIVHEYGHLLGMEDDVRYARDPLFVMGWDILDVHVPACAGFRAQRLIADAKRIRSMCVETSRLRETRRGRQRARAGCQERYAAKAAAAKAQAGI